MEKLRLSGSELRVLDELTLFKQKCEKGRDVYVGLGHSSKLGLVTAYYYGADDARSISQEAIAIDTALLDTLVMSPSEALAAECMEQIAGDPRSMFDGKALPHEFLCKATLGHAPFGNAFLDPILDQVEAIIRRHLPDGANDVLTPLCQLHEWKLRQALRYLTSGDAPARAQALSSFPLLSTGIVEGAYPDILDAVDARQELLPVIAERFQLLSGELKTFSLINTHISRLMNDPKKRVNIEEIAAKFSFLKVSRGKSRPWDPTSQLLDAALSVSRTISYTQLSKSRDYAGADPVLAGMADMWSLDYLSKNAGVSSNVFRSSMRRLSGDLITEEVKRHRSGLLRHVGDFTKFLDRSIANAIFANAIREVSGDDLAELHATGLAIQNHQAIDALPSERMLKFLDAVEAHSDDLKKHMDEKAGIYVTRNMRYKHLKEANTLWHHNATRIEARLLAETTNLAWIPLIGDISMNALRGRELVSTADFIDQGECEGHCIATYAREVMESAAAKRDLCIVMSIESDDGSILSTAEFRGKSNRKSGHWSWTLSENLAAGNTEAPIITYEVTDKVIDHLNRLTAAKMNDYFEGHRIGDGQLNNRFAQMVNKFGADLTDPDLSEKILASIMPYLPEDLRQRDIHDWSSVLSSDGFESFKTDLGGAIALREADQAGPSIT